jgi:hypothetical protein
VRARSARPRSASKGLRNDRFITLARGRTDAEGGFVWNLATRQAGEIKRIVVQKGLDTLVLEPTRGPAEYRDENWTKPEDAWLAWSTQPEPKRAEEARTLCHVFTERPIYRPEEPVHIKGWSAAISAARSPTREGRHGGRERPGDGEWTYPVTLDQVGGFYHKFDVTTEATGDYSVRFKPDGQEETCGEFPFKKEAYRLPTFEVLLNGAARGAARRRVLGRPPGEVFRRRARGRAADQVARDAVSSGLDSARSRRIPVLVGLALLGRAEIPLHPGARARGEDGCGRFCPPDP